MASGANETAKYEAALGQHHKGTTFHVPAKMTTEKPPIKMENGQSGQSGQKQPEAGYYLNIAQKGKLILPTALWVLLVIAGICFLTLLASLNKTIGTLDTLVEQQQEARAERFFDDKLMHLNHHNHHHHNHKHHQHNTNNNQQPNHKPPKDEWTVVGQEAKQAEPKHKVESMLLVGGPSESLAKELFERPSEPSFPFDLSSVFSLPSWASLEPEIEPHRHHKHQFNAPDLSFANSLKPSFDSNKQPGQVKQVSAIIEGSIDGKPMPSNLAESILEQVVPMIHGLGRDNRRQSRPMGGFLSENQGELENFDGPKHHHHHHHNHQQQHHRRPAVERHDQGEEDEAESRSQQAALISANIDNLNINLNMEDDNNSSDAPSIGSLKHNSAEEQQSILPSNPIEDLLLSKTIDDLLTKLAADEHDRPDDDVARETESRFQLPPPPPPPPPKRQHDERRERPKFRPPMSPLASLLMPLDLLGPAPSAPRPHHKQNNPPPTLIVEEFHPPSSHQHANSFPKHKLMPQIEDLLAPPALPTDSFVFEPNQAQAINLDSFLEPLANVDHHQPRPKPKVRPPPPPPARGPFGSSSVSPYELNDVEFPLDILFGQAPPPPPPPIVRGSNDNDDQRHFEVGDAMKPNGIVKGLPEMFTKPDFLDMAANLRDRPAKPKADDKQQAPGRVAFMSPLNNRDNGNTIVFVNGKPLAPGEPMPKMPKIFDLFNSGDLLSDLSASSWPRFPGQESNKVAVAADKEVEPKDQVAQTQQPDLSELVSVLGNIATGPSSDNPNNEQQGAKTSPMPNFTLITEPPRPDSDGSVGKNDAPNTISTPLMVDVAKDSIPSELKSGIKTTTPEAPTETKTTTTTTGNDAKTTASSSPSSTTGNVARETDETNQSLSDILGTMSALPQFSGSSEQRNTQTSQGSSPGAETSTMANLINLGKKAVNNFVQKEIDKLEETISAATTTSSSVQDSKMQQETTTPNQSTEAIRVNNATNTSATSGNIAEATTPSQQQQLPSTVAAIGSSKHGEIASSKSDSQPDAQPTELTGAKVTTASTEGKSNDTTFSQSQATATAPTNKPNEAKSSSMFKSGEITQRPKSFLQRADDFMERNFMNFRKLF